MVFKYFVTTKFFSELNQRKDQLGTIQFDFVASDIEAMEAICVGHLHLCPGAVPTPNSEKLKQNIWQKWEKLKA